MSRYDHPNFLVKQIFPLDHVQGPAASLTDFAHFRSMNKCIVSHVIVTCVSLPSAITSFSLQVMRGATTIAAYAVTGFSALGDDLDGRIITLASSNTLLSASETLSLELDSTEKGKYDVVWHYQNTP